MQTTLKGWCAKFVHAETGEVNWALACPYRLEWGQPDAATGVTLVLALTCFGGCKQDLSVTVDKQFQLIDPWDLFKCKLFKEDNPPTTYFMHQFFPPGVGPNASKVSKKGEESEAQALLAKQKYADAMASLEAGEVADDNFLGKERKHGAGRAAQ